MSPYFGPKNVQDYFREPIDDGGGLIEAWGGIYHAEDATLALDTIKVAQRSFKARQHRQSYLAGQNPGIFKRQHCANGSEGTSQRAIDLLRGMTRYQGSAPPDIDPRER